MLLTESATARSSGELAWNPPRLDRAAYLGGDSGRDCAWSSSVSGASRCHSGLKWR
jgi:hypothetical protein